MIRITGKFLGVKLLLASGIICSFLSCSDYNRVLKGDDYNQKFDYANKLYDQEDYAPCIGLYEQIYQRMPKTGQGELSYYRIAKAYFEIEDYEMSGYYFGSYNQRFPYSTKIEEAMFLTALCSVYNSPEHTLDQTETEIAINNLQQFIDAYPQSNLVDSCNRVMDRLRYKIQMKDYDAVKLYAKTENYRAAVTSALSFINDYPLSSYVEEVQYLLVKNSYFLAINSIEDKKCERVEQTIERYRTFAYSFPNSKYVVDLEQMNEKMNRIWESNCSKKN